MKKTFLILLGFISILFLSFLWFDYQYFYTGTTDDNVTNELSKIEEDSSNVIEACDITKSTTASGLYYISCINNFVIVYCADRETVYDYTTIQVDSLSDMEQKQIRDGFYVKTTEELYQLLQSYSS